MCSRKRRISGTQVKHAVKFKGPITVSFAEISHLWDADRGG
jgi:hypothetical protein